MEPPTVGQVLRFILHGQEDKSYTGSLTLIWVRQSHRSCARMQCQVCLRGRQRFLFICRTTICPCVFQGRPALSLQVFWSPCSMGCVLPLPTKAALACHSTIFHLGITMFITVPLLVPSNSLFYHHDHKPVPSGDTRFRLRAAGWAGLCV